MRVGNLRGEWGTRKICLQRAIADEKMRDDGGQREVRSGPCFYQKTWRAEQAEKWTDPLVLQGDLSISAARPGQPCSARASPPPAQTGLSVRVPATVTPAPISESEPESVWQLPAGGPAHRQQPLSACHCGLRLVRRAQAPADRDAESAASSSPGRVGFQTQ